ncbi:MAG: sulfite exporter TauE/SafE family protein [Chloroflexota bacterium]|nr:sulfite exporter TauE/SafE family protein [Chloroflexota bacterium]
MGKRAKTQHAHAKPTKTNNQQVNPAQRPETNHLKVSPIAQVLPSQTAPAPEVTSHPNQVIPWNSLGLLIGLGLGLLLLAFLLPTQNSSAWEGFGSLWVVFLTGLTTGGLSCMAVQGGLLAASIAQREEEAIREKTKARDSLPILAFLGAKLVAYVLLGGLLGWLGSLLSMTPTVQAMLTLLAGLFMLATAFNLLNLHPIFRYVVIQPPRRVMKFLRRYSKSEALFAPALLGFFTILIPCGTTLAMEALAISSGSLIAGALVMGAFVLGTSPLFFVLGYFATRLGSVLHARFLKVAAVAILLLAVISINSALNLLDSPVTLNSIGSYLFDTSSKPAVQPQVSAQPTAALGSGATTQSNVQEVTINVTNSSYEPENIAVKSGQPLRITLVTNKTSGCTRSIVFRSLGIQKVLPTTGRTILDVPAQAPGVIHYVCSMGMYSGKITVI